MALACAVAAIVASVGSATHQATKQRVAIVLRVGFSGAGTFELIPLTPGPLKPDSGKVTGTGEHNAVVIRDGQRLTTLAGTDELKGKRGSLALSETIEIAEIGDGYRVTSGSWSFNIYTAKGQYKGFEGGGRVSGIEFVNRHSLIARYEGYLTRP